MIAFLTLSIAEAKAPSTQITTEITDLNKSTNSVLIAKTAPPSPLDTLPEYKHYAYRQIESKWGASEWVAFDNIVRKESGWRVTGDHNPALSTAHGLGGFLNATWSTVGCVKTQDEDIQIDCMIKYIEQRYSTPRKALGFHVAHNYY